MGALWIHDKLFWTFLPYWITSYLQPIYEKKVLLDPNSIQTLFTPNLVHHGSLSNLTTVHPVIVTLTADIRAVIAFFSSKLEFRFFVCILKLSPWSKKKLISDMVGQILLKNIDMHSLNLLSLIYIVVFEVLH